MEVKQEVKKDWSTQELASAAGVSRQYVVMLLNSGEIVGHKVGRAWVVRDYDARMWLLEYKREKK